MKTQTGSHGATTIITGGISRFVMLDRITARTGNSMTTHTALRDAPAYLATECMAQCAALHLRAALRFERHVFLLGMREVQFAECPAPAPEDGCGLLTGTVACTATRTGETESGAAYLVACRLLTASGTPAIHLASGEMLLSSVPYSERFPEQVLRPRYEALFNDLISGSLLSPACREVRP
ncbi:hypothetical protein N1030_14085 [Desulfovibrio mangrovi]|uniref:hypothetical protein n=1 Tax=Desulfovibrio mangrovi TaxID=2976983 RepID=UPI0022452680|nr:hypothetical protein [Desulfovibrio mangrovi]UZP66729.1 hypothetical protein N1030_14085 [Desulfovibrio mangrovi]